MDKLNGIDHKTVYGLTISAVTESFLTWPKLKPGVSHDFNDQNGIVQDLSEVYVESRQLKFSCNMITGPLVDFKNKWYGLYTLLTTPGIKSFYRAALDQTFYFFYTEQQNVKLLTKNVADAPQIGITFDLLVTELDPNDNMPKVFLVTEDNKFLIA
jgi:hypothetical protein